MKPLIIGVGGAGCRIAELFKKYNPIIIDTDVESLRIRKVKKKNKILIGKDILSGRGTMRNYNYAIKALKHDLSKIFERIKREYDLCLIISSFGGTGTSGYFLGEKIKEEFDMKTYSLLISPSEEDDLSVKQNFSERFNDFLNNFDAVFLLNNDLFKSINLPASIDSINESIFNMFNSLLEISEKDECIKINLYDIINSLKKITIIGYNFHKFKFRLFRIFRKEEYNSNNFLELLRDIKFSYNTDLNSAKRMMIISKYDKRYVKFSPSIVTKLFLEKVYSVRNVRYGEILNKKRKVEQLLIFSEIERLDVKIKTYEEEKERRKLYKVLSEVLNEISRIQNTLKNLLV